MTDIVSRQMEQIDEASGLLDAVSSRPVTSRAYPDLASECVQLRLAMAQLLDILGAVFLGRPRPASEQALMAGELLAEVPAACRSAQSPEDDEAAGVAVLLATRGGEEARIVTSWLRTARRQ
jgi:hypothetical protein